MSIRVVGIGGSVDAQSQSDRVLRAVLDRTAYLGAEVQVFPGLDLDLPPYHTGAVLPEVATGYVEAVRRADAVVISSPGYHGTVSGLVKNALDYLEELRTDQPAVPGRSRGRPDRGGPRLAGLGVHPGHPSAGRPRAARLADAARDWRSTAASPTSTRRLTDDDGAASSALGSRPSS